MTPSLAAILPASRIRDRLIDRIAYANDASYFRLVPQAVVQPNSIGEIQALFQFSQQNRIPMTFRAAGTSLSGQAVTDGILVDISKHWGDYSVEENAGKIRFQPGIVGGFINNVLKPHGRRIGPDPASIDACMMGGILANNSSGMCCGTTENSYKTIHSMTFVLPNGFVLDTSRPDAHKIFENEQPHIAKGLLELKQRILNSNAKYKNETLAEKIRRRYQMKNNNGYLLNAFLDFEHPLDILIHLLIGSEGTLGFIAEGVLHTLPDYTYKYTGQMYFKNIRDAAAAVYPIKQSGARAVEVMDRESLRSVEHLPGVPAILKELPAGATAILAEYQASDSETMLQFKKEAGRVIHELKLIHDVNFTDDPIAQAALWKPRKGIIASVGAMRPRGTTSVNEDVAFPVQHLADAVTDLRHLFDDFGYTEGVIFGHAKDGNLHFLVNQAFDTPEQIQFFDKFLREMVGIVSGKYDGSLKAEHGTGRNMAPFVETEWGAEAYAIMRDLKSLLDPDGMLNPGVLINDNPQAHVTHLKSLALVAPEIDKCIECGFCESKCPSRRLTLTPRQRIVVQRELASMRLAASDSAEIDSVSKDFTYAGIDTCALDGLCGTACPVGIDTGKFIKRLRAEEVKSNKSAEWVVENFGVVEKLVGVGVSLGHTAEKIIGVNGVKSISVIAEKVTGSRLPKWNKSIPHSPKKLSVLRDLRDEKEFIYFPSCISRQLGTPQLPITNYQSLAETFITIANRANINLHIPANAAGHCCGMPFSSKGYKSAYQAALHKTLTQMWDWSEHGKYPIVIDTTSCTHTLKTCGDDLTPEDKEIWNQLTILDGVEFLHDHVLPKLEIHPVDEEVILHPNCSARKLNLDAKMFAIAKQCAKNAVVPFALGCCAFAGDRGLTHPELTASATEKETAEILKRDYDGYYSSNITCEIGMKEATGKDYVSIVYLVEKASRP
ncbi:MAG: FAD-binding oxidoreductase [Anaerolineales bacterium]|uniref:FAD-binding and (Fe-S)-binding domain-containing protein n=1 Tax=Candidatus Villigracilis vicinus TaxID=3140679 RepID=UPI0031361F1E|nr:FAD-binding oxidoreductase [Anaerolineales bacterium]